jgi:hypothetical protein
MAGVRLTCLCLGCRHTWKGDGHADQWICREHWMVLPKAKRQVYYRAKRAYKRNPTMENWRRSGRIWARLKRMAIERSLGIA